MLHLVSIFFVCRLRIYFACESGNHGDTSELAEQILLTYTYFHLGIKLNCFIRAAFPLTSFIGLSHSHLHALKGDSLPNLFLSNSLLNQNEYFYSSAKQMMP